MAEDNEMPAVKNVLDGPVHVFKTPEQMEAIAQEAIQKAKESENATEEISN